VISELSDQAATSLLDCAAWAEGDGTHYGSSMSEDQNAQTPRIQQDDTDADVLDALNRGDIAALRSLISHLENAPHAGERLTRAFLTAVSSVPEDGLKMLLETNLVDLHRQDEINERNCLHKAAMSGRGFFLKVGLAAGVDPLRVDAHGRIPLHYACMNGHVDLIRGLVEACPSSAETLDLDNFTPLIHGVVHGQLSCVEKILSYSARVDPVGESDHVPLNLACQHGSLAVVELLLRGRPRILPDAEGLYPQHLVARFGRDATLLLMLRDYGADLDQPDKLYQWTPLFHAASEGRLECLQILLNCGVNASATDEKGLSALYYATWEGHLHCMATLAKATQRTTIDRKPLLVERISDMPLAVTTSSIGSDIELIPDLALPPPIIPTRRYGHNFLETKTTVVISFEAMGRNAVTFYDESKYPAARLTIAPRSADIVARNILLPIQEDNKSVSFEMDNLNSFAVDFDIFPTFGKKVLAKGSVPAEVFRGTASSSGYHNLSLLDPRLRSVGQICFKFQVIKPFGGTPLDITPFATYWKATSQHDSRPSSFVTGSSLSGAYVRICIQLSRDGVPLLYPQWKVNHAGLEVAILGLTYEQYAKLGSQIAGANCESHLAQIMETRDLNTIHDVLANSFASLEDVLNWLPTNINIELHLLYPSQQEEDSFQLGPTLNINDYVDSLLRIVFQHARRCREQSGDSMRSIVFTSFNKDLCTALNWKQPNCKNFSQTLIAGGSQQIDPVLLCNDLGADYSSPALNSVSDLQRAPNVLSIKEAVAIAQTNNFMGLICRSQLFDLVPALIEAIKVAGLVLVSDASNAEHDQTRSSAAPPFDGVPEGVDGILKGNRVLRFSETVDM